MEINQNRLTKLLSVLRREKEVSNTTQAMEILSTILLVRYFEIAFLNKRNEALNYTSRFRELINHYGQILHIDSYNSHIYSSLEGMERILPIELNNLLEKIELKSTEQELVHFINDLNSIDDFRFLADEYSQLLESMRVESSFSGEYFTPPSLYTFIVSYLSPSNGDEIYDPVCGSSGFLVAAAKYIDSHNQISNYSLYGKDIKQLPILLSTVNLFMHSKAPFRLRLCDSLSELNYKDNNEKFDVVLANPPFGKSIDNEVHLFRDDIYSSYLDGKCLIHVMNKLKPGGKAAVVLPERFLFDNSFEGITLRKALISRFNVECIVSMPAGIMLPYTGVKIIVVFFRNASPTDSIWFYNLIEVERFTKNKGLKVEDLNDFFEKVNNKVESKNSWNVRLSELDSDFDFLSHMERRGIVDDRVDMIERFDFAQKRSADLISVTSSTSLQVELLKDELVRTLDNANFERLVLSSISKSLPSKPLSKDLVHNSEGFEVYGGNGVIGYHNEFLHEGSLIVIGRVGAQCGNVRYVEGKIWVTNNAVALKSFDESRVHFRYLARVLKCMNLRFLATGTAQPHITINQIMTTAVHLPNLSVQLALERILTNLDEAIEMQTSAITGLQSSSEALQASINRHLVLR